MVIRKNINFISAKLLKKNLILCRAVGKAEFGARALGNRSILANPNENELKKKINEKVKGRDFWMPFAASVINSGYSNSPHGYLWDNLFDDMVEISMGRTAWRCCACATPWATSRWRRRATGACAWGSGRAPRGRFPAASPPSS